MTRNASGTNGATATGPKVGNELTFGRNRMLQLATCFAVDKNRKLMLSQEYKDKEKELEGQVNVVALDLREDVIKQFDEMETKPDIIISKLHKALGSKGEELHDKCLGNYKALMDSKYNAEFNRINLVPLACEEILVDRYNMVQFLKRMASVVNVVTVASHQVQCASPAWASCSRVTSLPADLPPFPIVVKPKSTAVKQMGLVFNRDGLSAFMAAAPCDDFSLEQYVPHSGVVYKVYVIAQHLFVGGRPSLPDVESYDPDTLRAYAEEIKGEYVTITTDEACKGYVVFYSDVITNRAGRVDCKRLQEYVKDDARLDFTTVNIFKLAVELEWNVELFGFDVLVDKNTQTHYVVDANVLPGFKGVDKYLSHMNKLFIRHAIRHGLKQDIALLNRNDHALKEYCIDKLTSWKSSGVQPDDLQIRRLVDSRIFQVKFHKGVRPDFELRKALVTFYNWEKPRRIIHDEINFIGNVAKGLFKAGLGPVQYYDINASYYGCERYLGRIEQWVSGMTLFKALKKKDTDVKKMFSCLGDSIARFHNVIKNKEFKETIVDYHFQKLEGMPLCFTLLEVWRRCALISTEKSNLGEHPMWSGFYKGFLKRKDSEEVKKVVMGKLRSRFSKEIVFSHFDVNLANAIVNDNAAPGLVTLIDIEWAGPSLAVYDFAKLISSLEIQIQRQEVNLTLDEIPELIRTVAKAYLERMGVLSEATCEADIADFVHDCYAFVPIACILNVYSNLIHASFDGQLDSIPNCTSLGKRGDDFNWIRHANDHFHAFEKYFEKIESE